MQFIFALILLAPFIYTAKDSNSLSGSISFDNSSSRDEFQSNTFGLYLGYEQWYSGVYFSQSDDSSEDSQTNEFGAYGGKKINDYFSLGGSFRRTKEPSSVKGNGISGNTSVNLHQIWESQYFTTLTFEYGVFNNDSDIRDEEDNIIVESSTRLRQKFWTVGLEQDISENLAVGASYTKYSYDDKSQSITTGAAFELISTVDGILGFPTSSQSYYLNFYPFQGWDFTYTHSKTFSVDIDDSETDDFRLGYTYDNFVRMGGSYTKLTTSGASQYFYGISLAVYF